MLFISLARYFGGPTMGFRRSANYAREPYYTSGVTNAKADGFRPKALSPAT
jgi:hypothetical protein